MNELADKIEQIKDGNELDVYVTEGITEDEMLMSLLVSAIKEGSTEYEYLGRKVVTAINNYIEACAQQEVE